MKKLLAILLLFSFVAINAQKEERKETKEERRQRYINEGNPFKKYGYTPKIATLSKGKYREFFVDTIIQIGSFKYNRVSKKIIGFTLYNKENLSEADLQPELVSRWMSPDPLSDEYPSWSPYNFVKNNPVRYIDPDGRAVYDPGDKFKSLNAAVLDFANQYNGLSIRANLEIGTRLYSVTEGNETYYSYSTPAFGGEGGIDPNIAQDPKDRNSNAQEIGDAHTHGTETLALDPSDKSKVLDFQDGFSGGDINIMDNVADDKSRTSEYFSYVVLPSGFAEVNQIKVGEFNSYDRNVNKLPRNISEVNNPSNSIPSDPNSGPVRRNTVSPNVTPNVLPVNGGTSVPDNFKKVKD